PAYDIMPCLGGSVMFIIERITVFQSAGKATSRMKVPDSLRRPFYVIHDLRNCMRDIEFWAHTVETRRAIAFANYKIGQEQKLSKK
ncbi:MAG: hypothetical protein K2I61_06140, partial [Muribaculaceae bacterium]|nr:hypothetical protein [Muribaculaceae bacterium]